MAVTLSLRRGAFDRGMGGFAVGLSIIELKKPEKSSDISVGSPGADRGGNR